MVALYSIGINILLASLKAGLAVATGSLALAADAIHSLVDVVASAVVLAGLLIARRKTRSFPYGLYKVENLVSVVVALLIFLAGYEIAREAVAAPFHQIASSPAALGGVGLTVLIPYLFSRYERRVAEENGSPSLKADSQHFRTDMLSSAVVFATLVGAAFNLPLDRIGAGLVVLFVLKAGWGLLADGMRVLLDASLSPETLDQVRRVIVADQDVAEIRSLVGRNSGRFKFLEAELTLRTSELGKAHQVSQRIEAAIRESVPHVDRVLIHYEPVQKEIWRWAVPVEEPGDRVSAHLGEAPYFVLVDVRRATGEVTARQMVANPNQNQEKKKGIHAAEFLVSQGIDGLAVKESLEGKGPFYVLDDAGVRVMITAATTLDELLAELPRQ